MSYAQIPYPRLRELLDTAGTQLVEVLPPAEYAELHLPGATSIPLKPSTSGRRWRSTAPGRSSSTAGTASET